MDKGFMRKNAYSLTELLMAFLVLGTITTAIAALSLNTFKASTDYQKQIDTVNYTRFSSERIQYYVSMADYIFPPGTSMTIASKTINTNNSIAILLYDDVNSDPTSSNYYYYLKVFYLSLNTSNNYYDLNEFTSSVSKIWAKNKLPGTIFTGLSGSTSLLISNIDNSTTTLSYLLDNTDGVSDDILKGALSNATVTDSTALIKGVDWNLFINHESSSGAQSTILNQGTNGNESTSNSSVYETSVKIKGISKNVPRYIN